jgi:hypothetical protein
VAKKAIFESNFQVRTNRERASWGVGILLILMKV